MRVYLTSTSGAVTDLVVLGGLESLLDRRWAVDVYRPPESERYTAAGTFHELAVDIRLVVRAGAVGGADAADAVRDLVEAAAAASSITLEEGGDRAVRRVAAFSGAGNPRPLGPYSYALELRWLAGELIT